MRYRNYTHFPVSGEILGADPSGRAVLIRVIDVPSVVKAKGGGAGSLAIALAPQTIEHKVYTDMAAQIRQGLAKEGVLADVQVVSPLGFQPVGSSPIWRGVAIGLGALTAGFIGWKLVSWKR